MVELKSEFMKFEKHLDILINSTFLLSIPVAIFLSCTILILFVPAIVVEDHGSYIPGPNLVSMPTFLFLIPHHEPVAYPLLGLCDRTMYLKRRTISQR